MRGLIRFIVRHHFVLLFLVYLSISLMLIFNFNSYHRSYFVNTVHNVTGGLEEAYGKLIRYFSLKDENLRLIEENNQLRNKLSENKVIAPTDSAIFDTVIFKSFDYVSARVINNTTNKKHNYLTINVGSLQGIEPNMGVISDEGLVGIVKSVSKNYSTVLSVLNLNFRLSAKFQNNQYFGRINWDGKNYQYISFDEILHHVPVGVGDSVVTNSFSNIFPEGILIGIVSSYDVRGNFYRIKLKLATDMRQVNNVYVIKNLDKEEIVKLQEKEND